MLLRCHIAQHRSSEPANHCGADCARDVVVARRDVGGQRAERVERRFSAACQLPFHVYLDLLHWDMAGSFDHDLATTIPRDLGQLAQGLQFCKLRGIVSVRDRARSQAVSEREGDIVAVHDFADIGEALVKETLLVMRRYSPWPPSCSAARHTPRRLPGNDRSWRRVSRSG